MCSNKFALQVTERLEANSELFKRMASFRVINYNGPLLVTAVLYISCKRRNGDGTDFSGGVLFGEDAEKGDPF